MQLSGSTLIGDSYPGHTGTYLPAHTWILRDSSAWTHVFQPTTVACNSSCVSPTNLAVLDLPIELVQFVMDLLPTFGDRARLCRVCRATRSLEWCLAPPLRATEEMSGLGLGDKGARAVALAVNTSTHGSVRELSLGNNNIGDVGAKSMVLILGRGSTLRRLSLRDNNIGDEGAVALARALKDNSELEELDLWGNSLGQDGKCALLSTARCKVFLELALLLPRGTPLTSGEMELRRTQISLFDWLSQIHYNGSIPAVLQKADPQDLLFSTFSLVKTYFSLGHVPESEWQLIGVACMLVTASLHGAIAAEDVAHLAHWLAFVTDGVCTEVEICGAARRVRMAVGFKMYQPTSYHFLRRYLRKTGWNEQSFSLANYLIELAASEVEFSWYRSQTVAAAAALLSRRYLGEAISTKHVPCWKSALLCCAHVDVEQELAPCAAAMARLHEAEHGCNDKFVNRKYEWSRLHMVARIKPDPAPDAAFFVSYLAESPRG